MNNVPEWLPGTSYFQQPSERMDCIILAFHSLCDICLMSITNTLIDTHKLVHVDRRMSEISLLVLCDYRMCMSWYCFKFPSCELHSTQRQLPELMKAPHILNWTGNSFLPYKHQQQREQQKNCLKRAFNKIPFCCWMSWFTFRTRRVTTSELCWL